MYCTVNWTRTRKVVINNQLAKGESRRVMYIENKDGDIDGEDRLQLIFLFL